MNMASTLTSTKEKFNPILKGSKVRLFIEVLQEKSQNTTTMEIMEATIMEITPPKGTTATVQQEPEEVEMTEVLQAPRQWEVAQAPVDPLMGTKPPASVAH